jgi:hypothetical protein
MSSHRQIDAAILIRCRSRPEERDYIVKGVHAMTLVVGEALQAWSGKLHAAQKAMAGWEGRSKLGRQTR